MVNLGVTVSSNFTAVEGGSLAGTGSELGVLGRGCFLNLVYSVDEGGG